jgi:hypothetical protein
MANTTNFGWETPDDTDLVKDGAAAMRTLGNSIDASFVDLKGGTTGQILSKNSNTDLDFTWITGDDANAIQNAIVDAKGDLISATAADTPARLAVGTNNQVLMADSSTATGLKYANEATATLTTTGDVIYASAANTLARLGIGTAGQVLTVNSGATAPQWTTPSSGGMTLISTTTLTGASISLTSIPSTYRNLRLVVRNWRPVDDAKGLFLRFNGDSGANRHTQQKVFEASAQTFAGTSIDTGYGTDNTTDSGIVVIDFPDYANTSTWKYCQIISFVSNETTVTSYNYRNIFGAYNQTGAISSLTLFPETGNFNAGTALLYGVA